MARRRLAAAVLAGCTGLALAASGALPLAGAQRAAAQLVPPGPEPEPPSGDPPASPAPPVVHPDPPGRDAETFGFDAAHTFWASDPSLRPPFALRWKAALPAHASKLLAVDGRVFVSVGAEFGGDDGFKGVVALDAGSGRELWRVATGVAHPETAYAAGRLVVADAGGPRGLDPASGALGWEFPLGPVSELTPAGGDVLFEFDPHDAPERQGLYAVDAASGSLRWRAGGPSYGTSRVAVAGDRVYRAESCSAAAIDRRDGTRIWTRTFGCSGGSGETAGLWRDRVIVGRGALSAHDGSDVPGTPYATVLAGDVGVRRDREYSIGAFDLESGAALWSFATRDYPNVPAPVAVDDLVLVADGVGLHAIERRSGRVAWSGQLNSVADSFRGPRQPVVGASMWLIAYAQEVFAIAPEAQVGAPALELRPEQAVIEYGRSVKLDVQVGGELTSARALHLDVDAFPPGGARRDPAQRATGLDGRAEAKVFPSRATHYRVSADGAANDASTYAFVLPRYRTRFTRPSPNRVRVRVAVRVPRDVRLRGRRIGIYVGRARARRYVRLDTGRLRGRRGRYTATLSFDALSRVGRRDFIALCTRGVTAYGLGLGDAFDRRCGAARIRF